MVDVVVVVDGDDDDVDYNRIMFECDSLSLSLSPTLSFFLKCMNIVGEHTMSEYGE